MSTPNDWTHWAQMYLTCTLRADEHSMQTLLSELGSARDAWCALVALGAVAADTLEAFTTADTAANVLSRQLVRTALDDTARP